MTRAPAPAAAVIVAGSHGFDIWSPTEGTLEHAAGGGFEELIERVTGRVREEDGPIEVERFLDTLAR